MKKLGICLLAIAMMLGFAACQKDAGTGNGSGNKKWVATTMWINTSTSNYYLNEQDAIEAGYSAADDEEDDEWLNCNVFVFNNPKFDTVLTMTTYTRNDENLYDEEHKNVYTSNMKCADDFSEFTFDEGFAILDGKAFFCQNSYWVNYSLEEKGSSSKTVYAFNDDAGTNLTVYAHKIPKQ